MIIWSYDINCNSLICNSNTCCHVYILKFPNYNSSCLSIKFVHTILRLIVCIFRAKVHVLSRPIFYPSLHLSLESWTETRLYICAVKKLDSLHVMPRAASPSSCVGGGADSVHDVGASLLGRLVAEWTRLAARWCPERTGRRGHRTCLLCGNITHNLFYGYRPIFNLDNVHYRKWLSRLLGGRKSSEWCESSPYNSIRNIYN